MDICIDFDGTCVTHEFPLVGKDIGAVPVLKELVQNGHRLILFTMRSDVIGKVTLIDQKTVVPVVNNYLTDAVNWFKENDIPLYGIQTNPTQNEWTSSPKAYGQLYIDDAALGAPLVHSENERPYIDWTKVKTALILSSAINYSMVQHILDQGKIPVDMSEEM